MGGGGGDGIDPMCTVDVEEPKSSLRLYVVPALDSLFRFTLLLGRRV